MTRERKASRARATVEIVTARTIKGPKWVSQYPDKADDLWVIDQGLEPGLRLVVEGVQRLRKGAKVTAQPYEPPAAAPPAATTQG